MIGPEHLGLEANGPEGTGTALEIRRWYSATPEEVFRAFTEPALLRQWWGPKDFEIEEIDFPAVAGERYRVSLRSPDGSRFAHEGRFREVLPPFRLIYTWRWVEGPLQRAPTLVDLRFRAGDDGTWVELRHSRFESEASRDAHRGWPDSFDRLEAWLREAAS